MSFDESSSRDGSTPESYGLDQNNCAVGAKTLGSRDSDWTDHDAPKEFPRRTKRRTSGPNDVVKKKK